MTQRSNSNNHWFAQQRKAEFFWPIRMKQTCTPKICMVLLALRKAKQHHWKKQSPRFTFCFSHFDFYIWNAKVQQQYHVHIFPILAHYGLIYCRKCFVIWSEKKNEFCRKWCWLFPNIKDRHPNVDVNYTYQCYQHKYFSSAKFWEKIPK